MQSNGEQLKSRSDPTSLSPNESYGRMTVIQPGITSEDTGVYYSTIDSELQTTNYFGMNTNEAYSTNVEFGMHSNRAYGTRVESADFGTDTNRTYSADVENNENDYEYVY